MTEIVRDIAVAPSDKRRAIRWSTRRSVIGNGGKLSGYIFFAFIKIGFMVPCTNIFVESWLLKNTVP